MFELVDNHGQVACMASGEPFRYSSRQLARVAKRYLDALRHDGIFYHVRGVA